MSDLNEQQKQAVTTLDGPLLVLSGAGTGKTRLLASKIVHILYNFFIAYLILVKFIIINNVIKLFV